LAETVCFEAFYREKTVREGHGLPEQAGSPGSSQGLDARRLEGLYGAAERVNEQVGEQDIPRYKSPIDSGISDFTSSAQLFNHLSERLFEIQGILWKNENRASLWLFAFLLQMAFRDSQVRFAFFGFPDIKEISFSTGFEGHAFPALTCHINHLLYKCFPLSNIKGVFILTQLNDPIEELLSHMSQIVNGNE
jgi:hypothetical protein